MALIARPYTPADFMPVRDMLVETFRAWPQLRNWRLERWNWCRYSCVPYLVSWPRDLHPTPEESLAGIRFWEEHIRVWEDDGRIVGMVHTESGRELGQCFVERRPGYSAMLPKAIEWAEAHLAADDGKLVVWAADGDDELCSVLTAKGYVLQSGWRDPNACYAIGTPPTPTLPEGFTVSSMAKGGDISRRAEAIGRGFGHENPRDWGTVAHYQELLNAPDYDPTLALHTIAPDGRYASACIVWHDRVNQIGILEPVATVPEFRRMGLGRAVIYEGIRRVAQRGATEVWVGSDQAFYQAIGFRVSSVSHGWSRVGA